MNLKLETFEMGYLRYFSSSPLRSGDLHGSHGLSMLQRSGRAVCSRGARVTL